MLVALGLFLLSPITLLGWAAGQGLLRATGLRWWKLAFASMASLAVVIVHQGGVGPALAHHFAGYLWLLRQVGKPILTCRCRGRSYGRNCPWPCRWGCWPPR
jgi:hypothetical protein